MSVVIYSSFKVVFATLYPAYASYKAIKTRNVKDYVKWMMYWVVFAFFISIETVLDIFVAWLPFYYELKILFVLWILSPTTKGSSILYRKILHPQLSRREEDIDNYIGKATERGYSALLTLCQKGLALATNVVLAGAVKGQSKLLDHLNKPSSEEGEKQDGSKEGGRRSSDQFTDEFNLSKDE